MLTSQKEGGWTHQLCETDRMIVMRKRRDVQKLIQKIIDERPSSGSDDSLALVPVHPQTTSIPRHLHLDWDDLMDPLYQQISIVIGIPTQVSSSSSSTAPETNNSLVPSQSIKSLRSVMEKELLDLGAARLQKMECATCHRFHPTDSLYVLTVPSGTHNNTVTRCNGCWKGPFPSRSLFGLLIKGIADKWAKMVGKRVECLYGEWDERLNPMVKLLKDNVLLAEDIAALLRSCTDPQEFKDACEVIILTTVVFYLEYVDFRRSCEALIASKPTVTHSQLFEIFTIYFPNRAKGIKTGDFL